jgi:hypothetical protein
VDVEQIGLRIEAQQARAGTNLKALFANQKPVQHPSLEEIDEIDYAMFCSRDVDGAIRTCTTLKPAALIVLLVAREVLPISLCYTLMARQKSATFTARTRS